MKNILALLCITVLSLTSLTYAQSNFDAFLSELFDESGNGGDFDFNDGLDSSYDSDSSNSDNDILDDIWYVEEDYSSSEIDRAVQWMYGNGLTMFYTTDKFEPGTVLSREAAAKFFGVYAYQTLKKTESHNYDCEFNDIGQANPGLVGNIGQACRLGLFKGENGNYLPKSMITNAQAITVLIKAIEGVQPKLDRGHWALPYYYRARKLGLLDDLYMFNSDNLDKPATRGEIALMMFRTRNM